MVVVHVLGDSELTWFGYGLTLVPGRNELEDPVPFGLRRSLERHERCGQIRVEWDAEPVAEALNDTPVPESTPPPAPSHPHVKRRKK
jgi:hypothetical protein